MKEVCNLARRLEGKKVAVLVETEYIHEEMEYYKEVFVQEGAQVDFMTNLGDSDKRHLICDITDADNPTVHTMYVDKDIQKCNPNDYAIVIVGANYVACRLREIPPMGSLADINLLRTPPAVRFFANAMMNPQIVKGAMCHALWLLTPTPELLADRKVICHTVVLADIHNAGAIYVPDPSHVVVDRDLVTARSAGDLDAYVEAMISTYNKIYWQWNKN